MRAYYNKDLPWLVTISKKIDDSIFKFSKNKNKFQIYFVTFVAPDELSLHLLHFERVSAHSAD